MGRGREGWAEGGREAGGEGVSKEGRGKEVGRAPTYPMEHQTSA